MTYFAVHDADGNLVSTGTIVADDLADRGLAALELMGDGPPQGKLWNPATKAFDIEAPAPSAVIERLEADPDYQSLPAAQQAVTRAIVRALGGGPA